LVAWPGYRCATALHLQNTVVRVGMNTNGAVIRYLQFAGYKRMAHCELTPFVLS
jgi:hypothetical protein